MDLAGFFQSKTREQKQTQQSESATSSDYDSSSESGDERPPQPSKQQPKTKTPTQKDPIFDLIKLPAVFAMVGSPKSGKSWCIKHFLVNLLSRRELQFGLVITGTKFNGAYDFILDQNLVMGGYDERTLKTFLRDLKQYRQKNKTPAKAFLLLDDMLGQIPWESPLILHMLSNYRHYGLTVFIATQYIYKMNPTARTVCDYAFIWAQDNKRCYDAIYDSFGLGFDDFKEFKRMLDSIVSEQYACMLYNKEKRNVEERYQAYKAPDHIPDVRFRFIKQRQEN